MYTGINFDSETYEFSSCIWHYEIDRTPCNNSVTKELWEQANIAELTEIASSHLFAHAFTAGTGVKAHAEVINPIIEIRQDGVYFSGKAESNLLHFSRRSLIEDLDWVPWKFLPDLIELRKTLSQEQNYNKAIEYLLSIGCRKVQWSDIRKVTLLSFKDTYSIRITENDGLANVSYPVQYRHKRAYSVKLAD
jgi:hypothetical protein